MSDTSTTVSRLRIAPLLFGLVFVAVGLAGLGGDFDADRNWIWIGLLGSAGIGGLLATMRSLRS